MYRRNAESTDGMPYQRPVWSFAPNEKFPDPSFHDDAVSGIPVPLTSAFRRWTAKSNAAFLIDGGTDS